MAKYTKQIQSLFENVFSGGNFDYCDNIIAQNVLFHDPAAPNFRGGLQAYKEREKAYHKAFPKKNVIIEEIFESENRAIVRWRVEAIHKGDLPGIPATGNRINATGITIFEFSNGKISEIWQSWDRLGLLEQLGQVQHQAVEALR